MKKICIALITLVIVSCSSNTKDEYDLLKILFIGNSYTFNNDLPALVKELGTDNIESLEIELKALTPGGAKLKDHLNSSFALDIIQNGEWDFIIIQGHSLEPLMNPLSFSEKANELIGFAKKSGASVYLFETWSRATGNSIYTEEWSGKNPKSMQDLISLRYNEIAKASGVKVIPIGTIWQRISNERPEIKLYSEDGSHPTSLGTYLTACIIYKSIFNEDPKEIKQSPFGIKQKEATILQNYAGIY